MIPQPKVLLYPEHEWLVAKERGTFANEAEVRQNLEMQIASYPHVLANYASLGFIFVMGLLVGIGSFAIGLEYVTQFRLQYWVTDLLAVIFFLALALLFWAAMVSGAVGLWAVYRFFHSPQRVSHIYRHLTRNKLKIAAGWVIKVTTGSTTTVEYAYETGRSSRKRGIYVSAAAHTLKPNDGLWVVDGTVVSIIL